MKAEIITPAIPFLDPGEITAALAVMVVPDQVFEVRILELRRARGYSPRVILGYFDTPALVPDALAALRLEGAKGIYLALNPINPVLLARSHNKFIDAKDIPASRESIERHCEC